MTPNDQVSLHTSPAGRKLAYDDIAFSIDPQTIAELDTDNGSFDVIGQPRALRALEMAIRISAKGYNIFATGPSGTGKRTAVMKALESYNPGTDHLVDIVYVFDFEREERPRVLYLPAGEGRRFKHHMSNLIDRVRSLVRSLLDQKQFKAEKDELVLKTENWESRLITDFEAKLAEEGFTVVQPENGEGQADLQPLIDGEPVSFEELQRRLTAGEIAEEFWSRLREKYHRYLDELSRLYQRVQQNRVKMEADLDQLKQQALEADLQQAFDELRELYPQPRVQAHLDRTLADIKRNLEFFFPEGPDKDEEGNPPLSRYHVNVLVDHSDADRPPIVFESHPDYPTLFGSQEPVAEGSHEHRSGFMMLRAGSLVRASGGYLVLRAEDLVAEEDSWVALKRALSDGKTEIRNHPGPFHVHGSGLKPEEIEIDVKVIIMGNEQIYDFLWNMDPEFPKLFKVPAEFDSVMVRDTEAITQYVRFMKLIANEEQLTPLSHEAMAAIVEYGVRLSEFRNRLTTRFSQIADLIRESGFWAARHGNGEVRRSDVEHAIEERRFLCSLPEEKLDEQIRNGELLITVAGSAVGRINGLAVIDRGYYAFARPMLITARTSLGDEGVINIERESGLSGELHDKGVYILEGFLRSTYAADTPLSIRASIAFEQSYIEVDGDSASSTEVYALLSSISRIPLRQDIAVSGSVNQMGQVQAVGGISEKVEGFYAVCRQLGLSGRQGIVIPEGNIPNLILSREVQDAVREGSFHIYSVRTIDEGMEILTGVPSGTRGPDGHFPENTVNGIVEAALRQMADRMKSFDS